MINKFSRSPFLSLQTMVMQAARHTISLIRRAAKWQPTLVSCTVVGGAPYQSFACKLGSSAIWSRTCSVVSTNRSTLKIYAVDTAEYEDGGQPFINQYFAKDRMAMERGCKSASSSRQ